VPPVLPVLVFAVVGGMLTILSPCTLPVVPFVLGVSSAGGRQRILGVLLGFAAAFIGTTVLLASALAALDVTSGGLRLLSLVMLGSFGAMLAFPWLSRRTESAAAPLARIGTRIVGDQARTGLAGGVVLGAAIGLVWAPCVGPIMAAVIAAAATFGPSPETVAIAMAYVVGAAVPLAAIGLWGRRASSRTGSPGRRAGLQRVFGVAMIVTSVVVLTGLDVRVGSVVAGALPSGWSGALSDAESSVALQEGLDMLRRDPDSAQAPESPAAAADTDPARLADLPAPVASSLPAAVALEDLGPAPELAGITAWINSDPVTLASLRGKVVLVHFWTFGCINCIHVQPYVKAWYDRYAADGLVVIGVHTPELSFERDIENVRNAVADANVRFPVAFDPAYATWDAFGNHYWPAFYLVDKTGRIRHAHFGEGDYDGTEQVIRELLAEPG
jgi:cytochrome c biogenesis protein CcdA/thiol-disulfide isomerase/thioredoxin